MPCKKSKIQEFKRFLKRNMTREWAAHFTYQVVSFIVAVALVVGVATYAVNKTYEERDLKFTDDFTLTAQSGSYNTETNSLDGIKTAVENGVKSVEFDLRQSFDKTLFLSNEIVVSETNCTKLEDVFEYLKDKSVLIYIEVKETRTLSSLYQMILKYKLIDRVILTGISLGDVDEVKKDCPDIPYYLNYMPNRIKIYFDDYQEKLLETLRESGAIGINCNYKYACEKLSKVLHENGFKLCVSGVEKDRNIKRILVAKPDNIITRQPESVQKIIYNWYK